MRLRLTCHICTLIIQVISLHKGFSLSRQVISLNENWAPFKGDVNLEGIPYSSQKWESVDIPHARNSFDPFNQEINIR